MRLEKLNRRICKKELCCGCESCVQSCPKHCILMVTDQEGFQYPAINEEECINCGRCKKACPVLNSLDLKDEKRKIFAAFSLQDKIRLNSSSGGIFSLLASEILSQGGVVFGAAFDSKWDVHHIKIEKEEDLPKLRGSKYLQSRIEKTYGEVEAYLKQGRKVLFSGTGCQIAGLKQYLQYDYQYCYMIDVLCHGVPSPLVWKKYLSEKEKQAGACAKHVQFRDKGISWNSYRTKITFDNNKQYIKKFSQDTYMRLFLENIDLRPSCHNCMFKSVERCSDLTIGDAWGIEHVMPEFDDGKGTSLVIIQSLKGQELFEKIRNKVFAVEGDLDELWPSHSDSRKSVKPHANRELFFKKMITNESIEQMGKYLRLSVPKRAWLKIKRILWINKYL